MKWYCCTKAVSHLLLFVLIGLITPSFKYATCGIRLIDTHNSTIKCMDKEREALRQFKQGIETDRCGFLSSWDDHKDCCQWHGISCDSRSGHVIKLHLSQNDCQLEGRVSPSLVELKHLKYLDLSYNDFREQPIPSFIGSLTNLEYLNLSDSHFHGQIPHQLANLFSLTSLDLSNNYERLYVKSLRWLSNLTLLREIDLSWVDLSVATDWVQIIARLPFLRVLQMNGCGLSRPLAYMNMNVSTSLRVLGLVGNYLDEDDSSIFQWVLNMTGIGARLRYLDVSYNGIAGPIPEAISNLKHLAYLDLSGNYFQGHMLKNIGISLCSLQTLGLSENNVTEELSSIIHSLSSGCAHNSLFSLDLSGNEVWGSIPDTISTFSSLRELDLSHNKLKGPIPKGVGNLCNLQTLDLQYNNLTEEVSSIIHSLSSGCAHNSLLYLDLGYNQFWGSIPDTISTFSLLRELALSSCSLKGTLSMHHLSGLSRLSRLELDDNPDLVVNISRDWIPPFQLNYISMRSCKLGPHFPNWLLTRKNYVSYLDISGTRISDKLPLSFWSIFSFDLWYLNISHNNIYGVLPSPSMTFDCFAIDFSSSHIEGAIPSFLGSITLLLLNNNIFSDSVVLLCPKTKLQIDYLDLSNNMLSGKLPDCWNDIDFLVVLHLENNRFSGKLPTSIGLLKDMEELYLHHNSFIGELPTSFENFTSLVLLDISYNSLTGNIPPGISKLETLSILNLRSNKLNGFIPVSLCQMPHLQILDLSVNHISGTIPKCIRNLTAMVNATNSLPYGMHPFISYPGMEESANVMWKTREQSFRETNVGLLKTIAISDNQLQGPIPREISCLAGLVQLDLARNNFTGSIPSKIGELKQLEFLDLSSNHLSGQIPSSLANLNSLGVLNLSYNNLSGIIPAATQLQRQDPSAYMGNPGLCGLPLSECSGGPPSMPPKGVGMTREEDDDDSSDIFPGLYVSVVLGFIVGFWGVCGTLVIKTSWRQAFFRFVEDMNDKLHVMIAVTIARVWRRP